MSFCAWDRGEVWKDHFAVGKYVCSKCGHELFTSRAKYQHDSPWPAFSETLHEDSVSKRPDGYNALKVSCGKCNQGLGHEFLKDGPDQNHSRSLKFVPSSEAGEEAEQKRDEEATTKEEASDSTSSNGTEERAEQSNEEAKSKKGSGFLFWKKKDKKAKANGKM